MGWLLTTVTGVVILHVILAVAAWLFLRNAQSNEPNTTQLSNPVHDVHQQCLVLLNDTVTDANAFLDWSDNQPMHAMQEVHHITPPPRRRHDETHNAGSARCVGVNSTC